MPWHQQQKFAVRDLLDFDENCVTKMEKQNCYFGNNRLETTCGNLFCMCDSVAACNIQNVTQFSGKYGWNWCDAKEEAGVQYMSAQMVELWL